MNNSAPVYFLFPGFSKKWQCGGTLLAHRFRDLLSELASVQTVTYLDRESTCPYYNDIAAEVPGDSIWIMYWGHHVNDLQRRLWGKNVIFLAQNADFIYELSPSTAVICISRFIQSALTLQNPHNPIFLLYPYIPVLEFDRSQDRPTDILHLTRKSALYMRSTPYGKTESKLLPELTRRFAVREIKGFTLGHQELLEEYVKSKVYMYTIDVQRLGIEGFGMQPIEALLHGCYVFSEFGAGLSDFLSYDTYIRQIGIYSTEYDIERISNAVTSWEPMRGIPDHLAFLTDRNHYLDRLRSMICEIGEFFRFVGRNGNKPDLYKYLLTQLHREREQHENPGILKRITNRLQRVVTRRS